VAELHRGTITFVFTDIEGSTALSKQLRDRYVQVLEQHQVLLRQVFEAHGGREMDTQGDAFFFTFARAKDALAAAVEAQQALAPYPWPEGVELRVRMGLHTGEPAVGEERYAGFGVNRAARISAVGHGGQVLLSNTTRELVEDDVPDGVSIRELGSYRLKDIDRPERLFQLDIDGLQTDFPPLKAEQVAAPRPLRRRALLLSALAGVIAAAVAVPLFALSSGGTGGSPVAASIAANSVGAIDASSGRLLASSPTGTSPDAVAVGGGSVWVTSPSSDSVARIDPKTAARVGTVGVGRSPAGVAVGGGFAWVTNGLEGSVSKIDPNGNGGSGQVVDTIPVGNGPSGVAYGGGRVWVANSTDRTVSVIDFGSDKPLPPISVPQGADAIAFGSGLVWVLGGSQNAVTRIDARTRTVLPPISVGNGPTAIAVGAGAAWVANGLDGTVSRIDPSTGEVKVIPVGGNPSGVAAGSGVVWVSDERAGTLSRIDSAAGKMVQTLDMPKSPPQGLAVAAGSLYVAAGTPAVAHRGGTLRVLSGGFDSIDPAVAYTSQAWSALVLTNDGLVTFQRVGGSNGTRIVPDLASSLPTIADEGRTYTFQLRPGIRYSTGALVQPADFRRAIERSLEYQSLPDRPGVGGYFTEIVGGAACARTPNRCDLRRGVAVDPATRTITFHLTAPDPDFLNKLALPGAYAVPAGTPFKARLPLPATGPYMISRYDAKHAVTLVRNPRFHEWSPGAQPSGYPDRIAYTFSGSADAVKRGRADYALVSYDTVAELRRGGYGSQIHVNPALVTRYLFLNTRLAPFDRVAVRRALNYAVDRSKLARLAGPASGTSLEPTCQVLPPNFVGYVRYCLYEPDFARAKRLVAASGTAGQTVTVWTGSPGVPETAYLVSVLRSLGYKARLKVFPSDGYIAALLKEGRQSQTGPSGWYADFPAPSQFFEPLFTCASSREPLSVEWNASAFCDPRIDREISRASALQLSDPQAAASLWSEIDRDVMRQAPIIPVGNGWAADLVSRRVGNYQYNPQWGVLLDQLWVR
jgi:YVTN family beta-propeller protein